MERRGGKKWRYTTPFSYGLCANLEHTTLLVSRCKDCPIFFDIYNGYFFLKPMLLSFSNAPPQFCICPLSFLFLLQWNNFSSF